MKNRKAFLWIIFVILFLFIGFIAFLLYETQDQQKADLSNIEAKLNALYKPEKMGGFAVAVFNADSIIYSRGFGYSDQEKQFPFTTTSTQYIASISKTTIGIALMKAVELGLIELDDPINQYLPFEVSNPQYPKNEITIRHLATHTSSLDYNEQVVESLYIDDQNKNKSLLPFLEDYFQNGVYGDVAFTNHSPGDNWNYSNIGAGLAAFIVEYTAGVSFADFTERHIFEPLQLSSTAWFRSPSDSIHHSKYYEPQADSIIEVSTSGVQLYPCRDLITNMEDLTKYCQVIIGKDPVLLQQASYDVLLSGNTLSSVSNQEMDEHGIFFIIDRNQYGITYQLTGGTGGDNCINTIMLFDPKTGLGYNFIGNTGQSELNRVNHILIYRTLVSLGYHVLLNNPGNSVADQMKYKWHNWYNRVRAFF